MPAVTTVTFCNQGYNAKLGELGCICKMLECKLVQVAKVYVVKPYSIDSEHMKKVRNILNPESMENPTRSCTLSIPDNKPNSCNWCYNTPGLGDHDVVSVEVAVKPTQTTQRRRKIHQYNKEDWTTFTKVNRKVQEEPQIEVAANPWHQEEEKKRHRLTCA